MIFVTEWWEDWRSILIAALFYLIFDCLDIVSMVVVLSIVPLTVEGNLLMINAAGQLVLARAIGIKLLATITKYGLMSLGMYLGTRSSVLASIPWWIGSWGLATVVTQNLSLLVAWELT